MTKDEFEVYENLRKQRDSLRDALLAAEWSPASLGYCYVCSRNSEHPHAEGCVVDKALTKAGLPDQESRDAARVAIK